MISYRVDLVGQLWQRPDLEAALVPAVEEGTRLAHGVAAGHLRARGRGPDRYGHVADSLAWRVRRLPGQVVIGEVDVAGPSGFIGRFLEHGTRPHPILRRRQRRGRGGRFPVLAFRSGGALVFRQSVAHPGAPAIRWALRTQRETAPAVVTLLDRAIAGAVNG